MTCSWNSSKVVEPDTSPSRISSQPSNPLNASFNCIIDSKLNCPFSANSATDWESMSKYPPTSPKPLNCPDKEFMLSAAASIVVPKWSWKKSRTLMVSPFSTITAFFNRSGNSPVFAYTWVIVSQYSVNTPSCSKRSSLASAICSKSPELKALSTAFW